MGVEKEWVFKNQDSEKKDKEQNLEDHRKEQKNIKKYGMFQN